MSKLNADGNVIGRVGAVALIALAGFGMHRLTCAGEICPVMKTDSCCAFVAHAKTAKAPAKAVDVPSAPAK